MENKRKNIYIVVFVITTIIASCVAVYFGVMWNKDKQTLEAKIQEMSSQSNMVNKEEKNDTAKEESGENVIYKYTRPTIDLNKCINTEDDLIYKIPIAEASMSGLSCSVNQDKKSVVLGINWDAMKNMYQVDSPDDLQGNYQNVTINNFSNEIIDVYIQGMGQSVGEETILFLMKDPVYKLLKTKEYKSYGKLDGVSEVVDFSAGAAGVYINGELGPGYQIIVAIREDGSFYNLQPILTKTGNYNNF